MRIRRLKIIQRSLVGERTEGQERAAGGEHVSSFRIQDWERTQTTDVQSRLHIVCRRGLLGSSGNMSGHATMTRTDVLTTIVSQDGRNFLSCAHQLKDAISYVATDAPDYCASSAVGPNANAQVPVGCDLGI